MGLSSNSNAVNVARAHIEAWANHDWDSAREALTPDVKAVSYTHLTLPTTERV